MRSSRDCTRTLSVVAALLLLAGCKLELKGHFKVERFAFAPVSATDEPTARAMLGRLATLDDKTIAFDGQSCAVTRRDISERKTDDYLFEYHSSAHDLAVTQSTIYAIETNCEGWFARFFATDANHIVIFKDGAFYFLTKG